MSTHFPESGPSTPLPPLSAQRIDEMEDAVFADIARERSHAGARRRRRSRLWIAGGAAAAVVAVAAVIAPSVGGLVAGTAGSSDQYAVPPDAPSSSSEESSGGSGSASDATTTDGRQPAPVTLAPEASAGAPDTATANRDIITTASATVAVSAVDTATRAIGEAAVAHGGYVESMSIGSNGAVYPVSPVEGGVAYDTMPSAPPADSAWITVRVPADQLTALVDGLSDVGEVTATSVNRQDVTEQTVDLQARIDTAQASVDRLTELMGQAANVADLIAAESALSERQAQLESYQQQLEMLDDQVAMSTLSVTVLPRVETVTADPAGFGDGIVAGWNGLVATLNGIVIAIGFLLPWLVVIGLVVLVVWGVVRLVRSRRRRRTDAASRPAPVSDGGTDPEGKDSADTVER